jgi:hypothetical protein
MKFVMHEAEGLRILDDIEAAENKFGCQIGRIDVLEMIREVARRYEAGVDFEGILDSILDNIHPLSEEERHAYKYVLGRRFGRRARIGRKLFSRVRRKGRVA